MSETLMEAKDLKMHFDTRDGTVRAVDDVTFTINTNEIFGLVGESGCGKTTIARILMGLYKPTTGSVFFKKRDIFSITKGEMRKLRRYVQMVFQDPYSSLDPLMNIERLLTEPLDIHYKISKKEKRKRVLEILEKVGLSKRHVNRYAYEFSGGQRQRIAIARALITQPELVIADEPVSALDISIQAQILNLIQDLKDEFSSTYMIIAHDLNVIYHICDRVAVMYLGKIVELASVTNLFSTPLHPYTQALFSAIPIPDPKTSTQRDILKGEVASPLNPPTGCRFNPRCSFRQKICTNQEPDFLEAEENHFVACHFFKEIMKKRREKN